MQKNANGISAQLRTARGGFATNDVSTAQLVSFANAQFKNLLENYDVGVKKTNLLEMEIMAMCIVMAGKTIVNSDEQGLEFRGNFSMYLRPIARQLQREFNGCASCGDADTYDHTRRIPHRGKYNGKGGRPWWGISERKS